MNLFVLSKELLAVGLNISGCDSNGNVHLNEPDSNKLAPLVIAAHEKPLNSKDCLALKSAITEEQWTAYIDARKEPIRKARAERYKLETDALFMKAFEIAEGATKSTDAKGVTFRMPSEEILQKWEAAKVEIRKALPYEGEAIGKL